MASSASSSSSVVVPKLAVSFKKATTTTVVSKELIEEYRKLDFEAVDDDLANGLEYDGPTLVKTIMHLERCKGKFDSIEDFNRAKIAMAASSALTNKYEGLENYEAKVMLKKIFRQLELQDGGSDKSGRVTMANVGRLFPNARHATYVKTKRNPGWGVLDMTVFGGLMDFLYPGSVGAMTPAFLQLAREEVDALNFIITLNLTQKNVDLMKSKTLASSKVFVTLTNSDAAGAYSNPMYQASGKTSEQIVFEYITSNPQFQIHPFFKNYPNWAANIANRASIIL